MTLREWYARILFHTGLHAVVDKLMPRRLTILAGHCVSPEGGAWPGGEHLPADMKISAGRMRELLRWFGGRYRMVTVGEGVQELANGAKGPSLLALSMDDGYRDNHAVLLPLLKETGAKATVFLESRPLDERRVNWSHKLFWILARQKPFDFVHDYGERCKDEDVFHAMNQIVTEARVADVRYHVKRLLKYEADPDDRDRVIDELFAAQGGDERALCESLYMSWDEARALQAAGVELGGHTVNHPILARLPAERAEREIREGAESLERALGRRPATFAYPWGRRWDFDDASRAATGRAGFAAAVTMHAGANRPDTDRTRLHRLAIDDEARMHLLVAEACGGFELLRRLGLDLSE